MLGALPTPEASPMMLDATNHRSLTNASASWAGVNPYLAATCAYSATACCHHTRGHPATGYFRLQPPVRQRGSETEVLTMARLLLKRPMYPGNTLNRPVLAASLVGSKYFPESDPPARGEYARSPTFTLRQTSTRSTAPRQDNRTTGHL